jgi:hypothetical protein
LDTWLFCAQESLIQHKSLQTKQNIWAQTCCWHWCSTLMYLTCVLHLMVPIVQYSKLSHSAHYQLLQQITQNYPRSSNLGAAFQQHFRLSKMHNKDQMNNKNCGIGIRLYVVCKQSSGMQTALDCVPLTIKK